MVLSSTAMNEDGTFEEICNHYFGDGEPVAVESATLDANRMPAA